MDTSPFQNLLIALGLTALVATIVALAILWWLYGRLKILRISQDAELGETLRKIPLLLVVALDLLDMSLDLLSAPLVWSFLHHMGWKKLRNLATAAAVIPGTQLLPVLTISWVLARLFGKKTDRLLERAQGKGERTSVDQ